MSDWEVIQGDCNREMRRLTGEGIEYDLCMVDPPYRIGVLYGTHFDDNMPTHDYLAWCRDWLGNAFTMARKHASLFLLINHENAADVDVIARAVGFHRRQWLTWYESFGVNCTGRYNRTSRALIWYTRHKSKFTFNPDAPEIRRKSWRQLNGDKRANPKGKLWDDVWGINPPVPRVCGTFKERIKEFPTQLPLRLLNPIIAGHSNPGDLVLDPFSGSASTGEAALRLGRRFVGIELGERFAELSRGRLSRVQSEITNVEVA